MTAPYSDVIIALHNILKRNSSVLSPIYRSDGSANAAGDSLEYFMKDMFSPGNEAAQHPTEETKQNVYRKYLSWTGNSSNFPDFIVRGGVGVEPKKVEGDSASNIALNSSYPKDYITPQTQNVPRVITEDPWDRKEIVYAVGSLPRVKKGAPRPTKLSSLWMVYSNTYVANASTYQSVISDIREVLEGLPGEMMQDSKELGRVYGIDPLKYTNLRVRGMYELKHPERVFGDLVKEDIKDFPQGVTKIYLVILKSDYEKLGQDVDLSDDYHNLDDFYAARRLKKKEVRVSDPNNSDGEIDVIIFMGWTE